MTTALALLATASSAVYANDIAGTTWRVAELGLEPVSDAGVIEIYADRITGKAACNHIAARYAADNGRFTVGPVRSTRMACTAIALEARLIGALEQARFYRLDAGRLTLLDEKAVPLAAFVRD